MGLLLSRYFVFQLTVALAALAVWLGFSIGPLWWTPLVVLGPLVLVGMHDLIQTRHAILRNYPVIGHIRFMLEAIRPELRQYLIEDERDPVPFSREHRALVYRRAKGVQDSQPLGTVKDVNAVGYGWISHSIRPVTITDSDFRLTIGGPACRRPYEASVLNISGTSFGAMGANAIMAFNKGAKLGGFAHNTGEGSISPHHRRFGGDIIWQIATGYFGCRTADGSFDPEAFARQARDPQVKMIEVKLSQGAKPGHGGVLPKAKITAEIAATRVIGRDRDCVSPARHRAFSTPLELVGFLQRLRELSDGKPVGLKMAVGHRYEVLAIIKAMLETDVTPDFIVIDGGEGGTGSAPAELSNHVGLPLSEGLSFMHNALVGAGLRPRIRLGASGKIVTAYDLFRVFSIGADYAMAARSFMFAAGCIQSRSCHTNHCPTGLATQDPMRQRALVVEDKAPRVASYHRNTLRALGELLGAAGLTHPREIKPWHLQIRHQSGMILRGDDVYPAVAQGALLRGHATGELAREWDRAQADTFEPAFTRDDDQRGRIAAFEAVAEAV
jgi:glutamate synthase domain-containing protein 2